MEENSRLILAKIEEELYRSIQTKTIQIVRYIGDDIAEPCATAVLLDWDGNRFALTAGHVFSGEDESKIGVAIGNTFFPLGTNIHYENDDSIDLAIVPIMDSLVDKLFEFGYHFTNKGDIFENHHINDANVYFMMGYPASRTKEKMGVVRRQGFCFSTKGLADEKSYAFPNFNLEYNAILSFHRKDIISYKTDKSLKMTAPKMNGMSGSGLWLLCNGRIRLVGIMTEYDYINSVLFATKIHIFMEQLRRL